MTLPMGRVESAITENSCVCWPVSLLLQRIEVSDDLVDLVIAQLHRRHKASRFDVVRILNPQLEIRRGIVGRSRSQRIPALEMGKVWPKLTIGGRATDHMATDAGLGLEDLPAFGRHRILHSRLLLVLHPGSKIVRGL